MINYIATSVQNKRGFVVHKSRYNEVKGHVTIIHIIFFCVCSVIDFVHVHLYICYDRFKMLIGFNSNIEIVVKIHWSNNMVVKKKTNNFKSLNIIIPIV